MQFILLNRPEKTKGRFGSVSEFFLREKILLDLLVLILSGNASLKPGSDFVKSSKSEVNQSV
ncbi:MAG: hypothetical protein ABII06_05660 [Pseudomonadota bacterium]